MVFLNKHLRIPGKILIEQKGGAKVSQQDSELDTTKPMMHYSPPDFKPVITDSVTRQYDNVAPIPVRVGGDIFGGMNFRKKQSKHDGVKLKVHKK
jgi:hypothetical protein